MQRISSNSLVLYKQDSKTGKMLEGAVFKVTTPSGEEITLPSTDANGRVSTLPFSMKKSERVQFTVRRSNSSGRLCTGQQSDESDHRRLMVQSNSQEYGRSKYSKS